MSITQTIIGLEAAGVPKAIRDIQAELAAIEAGNMSNTIVANDNVLDIQTALDQVGASQAWQILLSPGSFGGATVAVADKQNILISGPVAPTDAAIAELSGGRGLTISGAASTRVRLQHLQIEGALTIDGTAGRHVMRNVTVMGGVVFSGAMTNWATLTECYAAGLTVPNTFGGVLYLFQVNFAGVAPTFSQASPLQVVLVDCMGLPGSTPPANCFVAGRIGYSSGAAEFYQNGNSLTGLLAAKPGLASTAPADLAVTAAVGTATTAARADHVHKLPDVVVPLADNDTDGLLSALGYQKLQGVQNNAELTTASWYGARLISPPAQPEPGNVRFYGRVGVNDKMFFMMEDGVERPISGAKNNFGAANAPTGSDDGPAGYSVGSFWTTVDNRAWICNNNGDTAAVWIELTGGGGGASLERDFTAAAPVSTGTVVRATVTGQVESIAQVQAGAGTDIATLGTLDLIGPDAVNGLNLNHLLAVGDNLVAIWYSSNNRVFVSVGTKNGLTETWGPPVQLNTNSGHPLTGFCQVQSDMFVVAVSNGSGSSYLQACKIVGSAIEQGTPFYFSGYIGKVAPVANNVFALVYAGNTGSGGGDEFRTYSVNLSSLLITQINSFSTTHGFTLVTPGARLVPFSATKMLWMIPGASAFWARWVTFNGSYAPGAVSAVNTGITVGERADAVFVSPTKILFAAHSLTHVHLRLANVTDTTITPVGSVLQVADYPLYMFTIQDLGNDKVLLVSYAGPAPTPALYGRIIDCSGTTPVVVSGPTLIVNSGRYLTESIAYGAERPFTANANWPDGQFALPLIRDADALKPSSIQGATGNAVVVYPEDAFGIAKNGAGVGETCTVVTLGGTFTGGPYTAGAVQYIDPATGQPTETASLYPIGRAVSGTDLILERFGPVSSGPVTLDAVNLYRIRSGDGLTEVTVDRTGYNEGKIAFSTGGLVRGVWDAAGYFKPDKLMIGTNSDVASAANVGCFRVVSEANAYRLQMCMQTGASTYGWVDVQVATW